MKTPLLDGEVVQREGRANLQRGIETVGGSLALTNRRLVFEPHALNVQTQVLEVPLASVASLALAWTKFLNLFPIFPNSLSVVLVDGTEHRFVVVGREEWMAEIEAARR
jgi:hypothetical protein